MEKVTYDLNKLAHNDIINTSVATRFFYNIQDYFDKLTEYLEHYNSYINHYNPTVVVVSDDERKVFIAACASVRALLTQLGMNTPLNELNTMENAALSGAIKDLSDGMLVFKGLLEITANHVLAAQNPPDSPLFKRTIMVVHDDDEALKSLSDMLSAKYHPILEKGGMTAIGELKNHIPEMFLIFTEMNEICGYELAFFIRENESFRHTPLLFLTETKDRSDLHKTLPDSGKRYIHLPVKESDLLDIIDKEFTRL
jgi:CheY-like chemotaxis protein